MTTAVIEVIRPGLLTTVQDLGRWGYQVSGVPVDEDRRERPPPFPPAENPRRIEGQQGEERHRLRRRVGPSQQGVEQVDEDGESEEGGEDGIAGGALFHAQTISLSEEGSR